MIKAKRLEHNVTEIPSYQTVEAAAFDLSAILDREVFVMEGTNKVKQVCEDELTLLSGLTYVIPTGWAFEIPPGTTMIISVRSSIGKRGLILANGIAVIDSDYRGEVSLMLHNQSKNAVTIKNNERIANAMVIATPQHEISEVEELGETERGSGGFGSTGQKATVS